MVKLILIPPTFRLAPFLSPSASLILFLCSYVRTLYLFSSCLAFLTVCLVSK